MLPTILARPIHRLLRLTQRLPSPVQDLAFSSYGVLLHRMRYGRLFRRTRAWLDQAQWWSDEEIRVYQQETLCRLLQHCARNVPYYQTLFARVGRPGPNEETSEVLSRIPILEKATVRENPAAFLARGVSRWRTIAKDTSGTTGTPMVFYATHDEIQKYWALADRARRWAGSAVGFRRATFSGMPIIPQDRTSPPYWRRDYVENKVLFSAYHLSPRSIRSYVDFLQDFRPEEMLGHPSCLSLLAQMWPADDPPRFRPKAIITTGETLFGYQKTAIEDRFGCRVSDQYSAGGEMGPCISMCESGQYHEYPESGIIELVDADGQPVPDGSPGQVVATGFTNWTMPLIRYRTGDEAQLAPRDPCPCGRSFRRYSRIEGKIADRLILPDGRVLGNIYTLVESYPNIRECQFRQTAPDRVTLFIVPNDRFGEDDRRRIARVSADFLGPQVSLTCEVVPAIDRTARGKLRLVVSEMEAGRLPDAS